MSKLERVKTGAIVGLTGVWGLATYWIADLNRELRKTNARLVEAKRDLAAASELVEFYEEYPSDGGEHYLNWPPIRRCRLRAPEPPRA